MRARRPILRSDFEAIDAGCVAAGLEPEYFSSDDVIYLWKLGKSVEDIVRTAVERARRTGDPKASVGPG